MEKQFSALCKGRIITTFTRIETLLVKPKNFQERVKQKCDTPSFLKLDFRPDNPSKNIKKPRSTHLKDFFRYMVSYPHRYANKPNAFRYVPGVRITNYSLSTPCEVISCPSVNNSTRATTLKSLKPWKLGQQHIP